jgi:alkanesulfonate monooxygenase SsuD/methylene tetrahydromethanopterin reductase-like flavin-dependent oxidoreductase (luciferase family)
VTRLRSALWLPLFDDLADPLVVARVAADAEAVRWDGRLTVGVGIGSDQSAREQSRAGEQIEDRIRGEMLDEALEILTIACSGEPVRHRGRHYTVDGIQFLPQPAQRSDIPVWAADFPGNVKPIRRAARLDGVFPANLNHPDQLAEVVATITELRKQDTTAYDFAVGLPVGVDPLPYASAGATWWLPEFEPGVALDTVQGVLRDGPARWTE